MAFDSGPPPLLVPTFLLNKQDILDRIANQADRPPISMPYLAQKKILELLASDSTFPIRSSVPSGNMAEAIGSMRPKAKLSIHAIYDIKDGVSPLQQALPGGGKIMGMDVPFNPDQIEHSVAATWAEHVVPGLSHKQLQYINTDNQTLKFDLLLDYMVPPEIARKPLKNDGSWPEVAVKAVADSYAWLLSMLYAKDGSQGANAARPPDILVFWPGLVRFVGVLVSFQAKWTKMLPTGEMASALVSLTFKERPSKRLTLEDVRNQGLIRGSGGQPAGVTSSEVGLQRNA